MTRLSLAGQFRRRSMPVFVHSLRRHVCDSRTDKWGKSLSKRIVLILAAAGLLALAAGYYVRRNSGMRLLAQAQEAFLAQQYQEAQSFSERYVARNADDYVGWRLLGQAQTHLGKYPQARQSLRRALECRPNDLESTLSLGRTYSLPGLEHLATACKSSSDQPAMFRSAIEDFGQAEAVLSQYKPVRLEEIMAQQCALGENTAYLARAWQGLANRLNSEAAIAQAAGEGDIAAARRALQEPAVESARQQSARAAKILLGVLRERAPSAPPATCPSGGGPAPTRPTALVGRSWW